MPESQKSSIKHKFNLYENIIIYLYPSFIIIGFNGFSQQSEILTNNIVTEMKTKGLPNSIILAKIKSSQNSFDISTNALIKLADNKIPEDIVNAIFYTHIARNNALHSDNNFLLSGVSQILPGVKLLL